MRRLRLSFGETSPDIRFRTLYGMLVVLTIAVGLASRDPSVAMPGIVRVNGGDVASAMCIFFGVRFWRRASPVKCGLVAFIICVLIELQQLYQAPWAVRARGNRVVGTLLGHGFLWLDLVRYFGGVGIGLAIAALVERLAIFRTIER